MDAEARAFHLDPDKACQHKSVRVVFDAEAAKGLTSDEVRKRWPRFGGRCPDCGAGLVKYASYEHYLSGDW